MSRGDIFFVNAGVLHAMYNAASPLNAVFKSITFNASVVGGEQNSVFWHEYLRPLLHAANLRSFVLRVDQAYHADVLPLLSDIWGLMAQEPAYYELLVRNGLSSLLCILLRILEQTNSDTVTSPEGMRLEKRMHLLLDHIHTHYSQQISLDELAAVAVISKTEVMRCFKRIIGKSPIHYLLEYRLQQAAYLLTHTQHPVQQIGENCGFEDSSYFAKSFRALYGMTPTEYRRRGNGH